MIPRCLDSQKIKTYALIYSGASICFIDELFTKLYKIQLVQKIKIVHVEVIDRSLEDKQIQQIIVVK